MCVLGKGKLWGTVYKMWFICIPVPSECQNISSLDSFLFPCFWNCLCMYVSASEVTCSSWYIQACGCSTWNQLLPSRVYMCRGSEFWLTQAEWAALVWAPHTKGLSCFWVTCGSSQAHPVCAVIPVGCRLACAEPAQVCVCVCAGAALEKWLPLFWFISERELWEFGHSD